MNYRKLIESFNITSVDEVDGIITVFGEDDSFVAEIKLGDLFHHHPGGEIWKGDRFTDRAEYHSIEPEELWKNGSDKGDPITMVAEVWDEIEKKWLNEDGEEIILPSNIDDLRWISVEDSIPTENTRYIVRTKYTYRRTKKIFYGEGIGYLSSFSHPFSTGEVESTEITHWMRMPEFKI